jgi:hypothetical protein
MHRTLNHDSLFMSTPLREENHLQSKRQQLQQYSLPFLAGCQQRPEDIR